MVDMFWGLLGMRIIKGVDVDAVDADGKTGFGVPAERTGVISEQFRLGVLQLVWGLGR